LKPLLLVLVLVLVLVLALEPENTSNGITLPCAVSMRIRNHGYSPDTLYF